MRAHELESLADAREYLFTKWLNSFWFCGKWYHLHRIIGDAEFDFRMMKIKLNVAERKLEAVNKAIQEEPSPEAGRE